MANYSLSVIIEILNNNGKWRKAVALLDSGSDVTLIKRDTVQKLRLWRDSCSKLHHIQNFKTSSYSCLKLHHVQNKNFIYGEIYVQKHQIANLLFLNLVQLVVVLIAKTLQLFLYGYVDKINLLRVLNITTIELEKPAHNIPKFSEQLFEDCAYLKSIKDFVPNREISIDIVIGFNYANLMKASDYLQHPLNPDDNPTGVDTPLGWYIYDPKNQNTLNADELSYVHHVYVEQNAENFQSLHESNVCGVKPTRICACSDKEVLESHFLKHVRDTIRQTKEGRVEVSLPWKEGFPKCLQFNRDTALAKLTSLEKRLNKAGFTEC